MKKLFVAVLLLLAMAGLSSCKETVKPCLDEGQLKEIFAQVGKTEFVVGGSYGGVPIGLIQEDGYLSEKDINKIMAIFDIRGKKEFGESYGKYDGKKRADRETVEKLERGIIDTTMEMRLKKLELNMELAKAYKNGDKERFSYLCYSYVSRYNQYLTNYSEKEFSEIFEEMRLDAEEGLELTDYTEEEIVVIGSYYEMRKLNPYIMKRYTQSRELIDPILREYQYIKLCNRPFGKHGAEKEREIAERVAERQALKDAQN